MEEHPFTNPLEIILSRPIRLVFQQAGHNHDRGLPSPYEECRDAAAPQAGQL